MSGTTPARPKKNGQFEPKTSTSGKNCVAATVAMLAERATAGRIRPTHADIRKWVLQDGGGRNRDGTFRGLLLSEGAAAAKALYGVTLTVLTNQTRDQVKNLVGNGRGAGYSIDARVTYGTVCATNQLGADKSKVAGHNIYVHDYDYRPASSTRCSCDKRTTAAHGEYVYEDPGTTAAGYKRISASLLYRAGEARTGGDGIQLLAGPDTESVKWVCIASTAVRKAPSSTAAKLTSFVAGDHAHEGGRTENGGTWPRANGSLADQWIHVKTSKGWGWVPGKSMRLAAA